MLVAICAVAFHLTEGQKVDAIFPENALDGKELHAVAFHAFPDSMSYELNSRSSVRDSSFTFRFPRTGAAPSYLYGAVSYLYGAVFCRQRQDERMKRGGEQRSIVVISHLPLTCILEPLVQYAGPLCLSHASLPNALSAVYQQTSLWSPLPWGSTVDLPLGNGALHVDLPDISTLPRDAINAACAENLDTANAAGDAIPSLLIDDLDDDTGLPLCLLPPPPGQHAPSVGLCTEMDVYTALSECLPNLWTLWEILLLGHPLLVVSPCPGSCSSAVLALASLLAPFPYGGDFRPYYTIHDPSFPALVAGKLPGGDSTESDDGPLPSLVGVTNPHFLKALTSWPNVLSTGYTSKTQPVTGNGRSSSEDGNGVGGADSGGAAAGAGIGDGLLQRLRLGGIFRRRPQGPQSLLVKPHDAAWLSYKPHTRPDHDLLSSLVHPRPGDSPARRKRLAHLNTGIIRRHFEELTRALLTPLLPLITPSTPPLPPYATETLEGLKHPPPLPHIDPSTLRNAWSGDLEQRLGNSTPDILLRRFTSKKALSQFYTAFLESSSLQSWLEGRQSAATAWQTLAWRQAWSAAGATS